MHDYRDVASQVWITADATDYGNTLEGICRFVDSECETAGEEINSCNVSVATFTIQKQAFVHSVVIVYRYNTATLNAYLLSSSIRSSDSNAFSAISFSTLTTSPPIPARASRTDCNDPRFMLGQIISSESG